MVLSVLRWLQDHGSPQNVSGSMHRLQLHLVRGGGLQAAPFYAPIQSYTLRRMLLFNRGWRNVVR